MRDKCNILRGDTPLFYDPAGTRQFPKMEGRTVLLIQLELMLPRLLVAPEAIEINVRLGYAAFGEPFPDKAYVVAFHMNEDTVPEVWNTFTAWVPRWTRKPGSVQGTVHRRNALANDPPGVDVGLRMTRYKWVRKVGDF